MATKFTGWCGKLAAVVFTSIVAPVLVNVMTRESADASGKPTQLEYPSLGQLESPRQAYPAVSITTPLSSVSPSPLPPRPSQVAAASQPVEIVHVIAYGNGRTPEAALQDALHAALRQALAAQLDAVTWTRKGPALCAGLLRNSGGLILGWKECGSRKEWGLRGAFYREEVAVEVNLRALVDRVRAGCTDSSRSDSQKLRIDGLSSN